MAIIHISLSRVGSDQAAGKRAGGAINTYHAADFWLISVL